MKFLYSQINGNCVLELPKVIDVHPPPLIKFVKSSVYPLNNAALFVPLVVPLTTTTMSVVKPG